MTVLFPHCFEASEVVKAVIATVYKLLEETPGLEQEALLRHTLLDSTQMVDVFSS